MDIEKLAKDIKKIVDENRTHFRNSNPSVEQRIVEQRINSENSKVNVKVFDIMIDGKKCVFFFEIYRNLKEMDEKYIGKTTCNGDFIFIKIKSENEDMAVKTVMSAVETVIRILGMKVKVFLDEYDKRIIHIEDE